MTKEDLNYKTELHRFLIPTTNSSARAGPRTPLPTPPTPPTPPPPPPPNPRDSIIHSGSLPAPSTFFPPLSTSLDAIPNNNNHKLPSELEALMTVEALVIPLAEEQIQRRELQQAEEQQRAEREHSRVREEEEKNEKTMKRDEEQERQRIQLEQDHIERILKQEAQAKLELCQQEELAATMIMRKKDLALEENHVNVEEEKEKVAPPLKPLLPKRRVYSWASFNSTPALEMHRQKKETHYSSSSSNNSGEAAGSKVAPDDQNNKLLAIHRERKLTYYKEADS